MTRISNGILESEWNELPKNWYAIYQWSRTSRVTYAEQIAKWIVDSISDITLRKEGLRSEKPFRVANHDGKASLRTGIEQVTEKRLVLAMFNKNEISPLGKVLDYEVPLKETRAAGHGDIDLLCVSGDYCFCVEAKEPDSDESLLKAVLQAYVYTSLVATKKETFLGEFELDEKSKLTPAVLTFSTAISGRQLGDSSQCPNLLELIAELNVDLTTKKLEPIRFFVIDNENDQFQNCLVAREDKVFFKDNIQIEITEIKIPTTK